MTTDCWRDLADIFEAGLQRVLLYGPPGTGKTHAGLFLGVSGRAERLVCTEDLTSAEITGTWMPTGGERWAWLDGPALRAWRGDDGLGGRLVVDEVDRASGDALSTLLAMTDSVESARWRHPETGEWVTPGANFSVVMTSNVESLEDIPAPLLDRFPVRIAIDRPHPVATDRLSPDLRAVAQAGSLGPDGRRVSLRQFLAFDHLRGRCGEERAASLLFGAPTGRALLDALLVTRLDA
jgi:MoxR-like ATPase